MALKHLELIEMVGLTRMWTATHRGTFETIPQLLPWLPLIDQVHARAVKAQPTEARALLGEIAAISAEQLAIDTRHDKTIRLASMMLEAEQIHCSVALPERAALCQSAHQTLFPEGLSFINSVYFAEAGYAERIEKQLADEAWLKELLASIPLSGNSNLLLTVESWCSLAAKLGDLEGKKAPLQAQLSTSPMPSRIEVVAARNEWIRVVNLVLSMFEALDPSHADAIETLRTPVHRLSDNAARRSGSGKSKDESEAEQMAQAAACVSPAAPAAVKNGFVIPEGPDPIPVGMPGSRPYI